MARSLRGECLALLGLLRALFLACRWTPAYGRPIAYGGLPYGCVLTGQRERPSSPVSLLTRVLIISWESPHLHDLILIWLAPKVPICKYHHTRSYVLQHRDLVSDTIQSRATRNSADLACFSISKNLAIRMGLCAE